MATWMVKHATWLYNTYLVHSDGKTSYERRRNHHYNKAICEFAETLLYKPARSDLPQTESDWDYGVWLGKCTQ